MTHADTLLPACCRRHRLLQGNLRFYESAAYFLSVDEYKYSIVELSRNKFLTTNRLYYTLHACFFSIQVVFTERSGQTSSNDVSDEIETHNLKFISSIKTSYQQYFQVGYLCCPLRDVLVQYTSLLFLIAFQLCSSSRVIWYSYSRPNINTLTVWPLLIFWRLFSDAVWWLLVLI